MNQHPNRRGLAAALSGTLIAGAIAGSVGLAAPANAAPANAAPANAAPANTVEQPVEKNFKAICKVTAGGLDLRKHTIDFYLETQAEVPLKPGTTLKRQDVSITLTMPKKLQKAVRKIGVTQAKGGSPNSAVRVGMPAAPPINHVTQRIALKKLTAPKSKVPGLQKPWKITSSGFVPRIHVPGFASAQNTVPGPPFAKLRLAPRFRINSTLFTKSGNRYRSVMKCTVRKSDRLINGQVPIVGPYVTDTAPVHGTTTARKSTKMQLLIFNLDPATADNSIEQPDGGAVSLDPATGVATYKPNRNFAGKDSFTYTAKDSTGESTSKVTIRVRKAPTNLKVHGPKKIRFGKRTNVRVRVNTRGAAHGKVRLIKGKRVLDKAKAGKAGKARLHIKAKALKPGKHKIRVVYAGSKTAQRANAKFTLRVLKRR